MFHEKMLSEKLPCVDPSTDLCQQFKASKRVKKEERINPKDKNLEAYGKLFRHDTANILPTIFSTTPANLSPRDMKLV
jgi:hypothetical protein